MAEMVLTVCDVEPRPGELVRHYVVKVDGATKEMDLCDRHAGVFAPGGATKTAAKKPAGPPRGAARRKVTTLAEIEKLKKK